MPSAFASPTPNATTTTAAEVTLGREECGNATFTAGTTTADALAAFRVERAQQSDLADINAFILDEFVRTEPLSATLEMSREEGAEFFDDTGEESSLEDGLSYLVRDPLADGRIIAVRLASIMHRNGQKRHGELVPSVPSFAGWKEMTKREKMNQIQGIMFGVEAKLWDLVPTEVDCVASWGLISVHSHYKRRGIAAALLQYKIGEVLEKGCQGIAAVTSARNSQNLFQKLGFIRLFESLHSDWTDPNTGEQVFKCIDGTDRVTLEFKPFAPSQSKKAVKEKNDDR